MQLELRPVHAANILLLMITKYESKTFDPDTLHKDFSYAPIVSHQRDSKKLQILLQYSGVHYRMFIIGCVNEYFNHNIEFFFFFVFFLISVEC
mmetsp:Transcript_1497/g.1762  ORF Transcript_1497/g.1762 Transcript_1497/m.1762 type:complete len:93 (-) Transcript_1497:589-867(-)